MSASLLLPLVVASLILCSAAAEPWSIHVPKSSSAVENLNFRTIPLPDGVHGAESLAFDRRGQGPYAGVSDGRVLKWGGDANGWATFAYSASYKNTPACTASTDRTADDEAVCGRPLGLQFYHKTGELYIADASLGLMKVSPGGGEAEVLATGAGGVPFSFVNGLDVDQSTGDVYFTDSSTVYRRPHNTQIMINRDATGRLMRYDARARRVTVLRSGLPYPNGVAMSADRTHVVVAHTGAGRVFRYWVRGAKAGRYERLADLPGYADNIRRDARGGYWVALNREKIDAKPPVKHLVGVRLDAAGAEHEDIVGPKGITLSDVAEKDGKLWLGSVELGYVGVVNYNALD
ncbi:hypothetical protein BS78_04G310900 [Paspalum vaginatum]|nr:hypothetical protein BS78_04G310900 [Paspalum vaginatum]